MLAGCAPCSPFSPYRRGKDTSKEKQWPSCSESSSRLVEETLPEIVTMENVPRIGSTAVFNAFVKTLVGWATTLTGGAAEGRTMDWPQNRRRLVLSRRASVRSRFRRQVLPMRMRPHRSDQDRRPAADRARAVRPAAIGCMRPDRSPTQSEAHPCVVCRRDVGGVARGAPRPLPPTRQRRDLPQRLRAHGMGRAGAYDHHLAHNFGAGRFGHPEQDRPISLREAAMLQGFPRDYDSSSARIPCTSAPMGRLIGNAVPPPLAAAVGTAIISHVAARPTARDPRGT